MDAQFLLGLLVGIVVAGLIGFLVGAVFGVSVGQAQMMKKMFASVAEDVLGQLRQGEMFEASCLFSLDQTGGDDGGDGQPEDNPMVDSGRWTDN